MTPAENALNSLYPVCLRIAKLHRDTIRAIGRQDNDAMQTLAAQLFDAEDELSRIIEAIEAGEVADHLGTSVAALINQAKRRASHN